MYNMHAFTQCVTIIFNSVLGLLVCISSVHAFLCCFLTTRLLTVIMSSVFQLCLTKLCLIYHSDSLSGHHIFKVFTTACLFVSYCKHRQYIGMCAYTHTHTHTHTYIYSLLCCCGNRHPSDRSARPPIKENNNECDSYFCSV